MKHIVNRHIRQIVCGLVVAVSLVIGLSSCASSSAQDQAGRIAEAMTSQGAEVVNLRPVAPPHQRAARILENKGFDIPGINITDKPAGTIRVYRGEQEAQADDNLYKLLGAPGPTTKLDYVNVSGTRELILDHRLPNEVAQRYIKAFTSAP